MTSTGRRLTAALCVLWLIALFPATSTAQEIEWHADRPLTWDDFKAPVERNAEARNVALTAASLGWSYEIETSIKGASCNYRISQLTISAAFHPEKSWVRPGHRTAAVLAHEQGHFDITQIHKLMYETLAAELVSVARACKGNTTRKVSNFIERELEQLLKAPYEEIWRNHASVQEAYDSETGHGTNVDVQQRWLALIAKGIDSERWPEPGNRQTVR